MILHFIIVILIISLLFYTIFAGADFGAGILEFFKPKDHNLSSEVNEIVYKAIGPVWEANHIWLILAVVIFFMGFPLAFTEFCTYYHIPLTFILLGIIGRGTAFTFRHYDAYVDETQKLYSLVFRLSSLWTSFWLGTILGSLLSYQLESQGHFLDLYVRPWLNLPSFSMGLFISALFTFLAALFLIGETENEELIIFFRRRTFRSFLVSLILGGVTLLLHISIPEALLNGFFRSPVTLSLFLLSFALLWPSYMIYKKRHYFLLKILGVLQVILVISGGLYQQFPTILIFKNKENLSFYNTQAPAETQLQLFFALVVGTLLIFPSLLFLFKVFKQNQIRI